MKSIDSDGDEKITKDELFEKLKKFLWTGIGEEMICLRLFLKKNFLCEMCFLMEGLIYKAQDFYRSQTWINFW